MSDVLLDTCALIWLLDGEPVSPVARSLIADGQLHISTVSALEIAILMRRGRFRIETAPAQWFQTAAEALAATLQPMTPAVLFASQFLPQLAHGDPFDRIVIATARAHGLIVVTRDRAILAYATAGHVAAMEC